MFSYDRTPEGDYKCPHCKFAKKNQSTVHMHIKANHSGTFKHKCKNCDYETSTKQTLDNHIMAKHATAGGAGEDGVERKEFACPHATCTFKAMRRGGMRSHYLLKHLSTEIARITGKDNKCTCCEEDFKSKPAFIYHSVKCLSPEILQVDVHRKGLGLD